eukprot:jgi/Botrbrau1/6322/Bobra.0339s0031.2
MMKVAYALACVALVTGLVLSRVSLTGHRGSVSDLLWKKCDNCSQIETSNGFVKVAPNVYRFTYAWRMNWLITTPVATFLVDCGNKNWILVDSGVPVPAYLELLIENINSFLSMNDGSLKLLVLTHHHFDHTGGVKEVLSNFPETLVVAHIDEKPFLVDGISTGAIPSNNTWFRALAMVGGFSVLQRSWPVERACFVQGDAGDLHDMPCESKVEDIWLPAKNKVTWIQAKGHAPGSLMLRIGNNILAGDVLAQFRMPWMIHNSIHQPPMMFNYDLDEVRNSIERLASLQFDRVFPSHDIGRGISKADTEAWAKSLMA